MTTAADLEARAHELRERARTVAAPLAAEAREVTTLAAERALLRLFGVSGLDRQRRPLALEVVERFAALGPNRLAGGIGLPFGAAGHEYELEPQDLAIEIAEGHIDLALEAELLAEPERRADAERTALAWLTSGFARLEANRTARRELLDALGEPNRPLVAVDLGDIVATDAARAARELARAGVDAIRLRVPHDRELRRRLGEELHEGHPDDDSTRAPAGSQRGLAHVRTAIDEAAVECGRYVALGTAAVGLSAPEQAVVAGFERVDLRWTDPLAAIVELGLEPDRAIADHLLAAAIDERSGVTLALGPGPSAIAAEVAAGAPVDSATRGGRALALQALSLELTLAAGMPPERILLGAVPFEVLASDLDRGLPELALRRVCFPRHDLCLDGDGAREGWMTALGPWLAGGSTPRVVVLGDEPSGVAQVRTAVRSADWLAEGRSIGPLQGSALTYAARVLDAALATLRSLASDGWEPILGGERPDGRMGGAGVVPRRDYFGAFSSPTESRGVPA